MCLARFKPTVTDVFRTQNDKTEIVIKMKKKLENAAASRNGHNVGQIQPFFHDAGVTQIAAYFSSQSRIIHWQRLFAF